MQISGCMQFCNSLYLFKKFGVNSLQKLGEIHKYKMKILYKKAGGGDKNEENIINSSDGG